MTENIRFVGKLVGNVAVTMPETWEPDMDTLNGLAWIADKTLRRLSPSYCQKQDYLIPVHFIAQTEPALTVHRLGIPLKASEERVSVMVPHDRINEVKGPRIAYEIHQGISAAVASVYCTRQGVSLSDRDRSALIKRSGRIVRDLLRELEEEQTGTRGELEIPWFDPIIYQDPDR